MVIAEHPAVQALQRFIEIEYSKELTFHGSSDFSCGQAHTC